MEQVLLSAVVPFSEHDMVSVGPVDVQVNLSDVRTVQPGHLPAIVGTTLVFIFTSLSYFISWYLPSCSCFILSISNRISQRVPRNLSGTPWIFCFEMIPSDFTCLSPSTPAQPFSRGILLQDGTIYFLH